MRAVRGEVVCARAGFGSGVCVPHVTKQVIRENLKELLEELEDGEG